MLDTTYDNEQQWVNRPLTTWNISRKEERGDPKGLEECNVGPHLTGILEYTYRSVMA